MQQHILLSYPMLLKTKYFRVKDSTSSLLIPVLERKKKLTSSCNAFEKEWEISH